MNVLNTMVNLGVLGGWDQNGPTSWRLCYSAQQTWHERSQSNWLQPQRLLPCVQFPSRPKSPGSLEKCQSSLSWSSFSRSSSKGQLLCIFQEFTYVYIPASSKRKTVDVCGLLGKTFKAKPLNSTGYLASDMTIKEGFDMFGRWLRGKWLLKTKSKQGAWSSIWTLERTFKQPRSHQSTEH